MSSTRRSTWRLLPAGVAILGLATCTGVRRFVVSDARVAAIAHVRVIDGTGRPAQADQTLVIQDGTIAAVGNAASITIPPSAKVFDGRNRTVIPGLVGMHEHLFYQMVAPGAGLAVIGAQEAFAMLYLASGVTTIRTAGTLDFAGDLRLKEAIDEGRLPGPKIHLTGPYLNARTPVPDPDGIAREVAAQAERGATSIKAYTSLRSSELQAAIRAADERGMRVTGHLCAVGFREAAAMGIDNLEHGLIVDAELYPGKQPDVCPGEGAAAAALARIDMITDMNVSLIIADLVRHGVAVTSTLAVFETFTGRASALDARMPSILAGRLRGPFEAQRERMTDPESPTARVYAAALRREMAFERRFVAAGGRLLAGVDPTGWGGLVAGFGDQRELELLVDAGFTPEAAIRIASANGADFLSEGDHIGTIQSGYQADLVLVHGNPAATISDVRNVEFVFKDGVAYDPAALIEAAQGQVGRFHIREVFGWPYGVIALVLGVLLVARILTRRMRRRAIEPV